MKIIKTILFSIFGLIFLNGGLSKWFNYMPVPDDLPEAVIREGEAFATIGWLMPLVGLAEILGGILILIPKTRALGALVLFPVLVGILIHHSKVAPDGLPIVLVIWILFIWILLDNRKKYLPLIESSRKGHYN